MLFDLLKMFTPVAYASVDTFIRKVNEHILNPVIIFLITLAVVYFIYGIVEYLIDSSNGESREKGQRHMLWGLIGLAIMVSVFFIMKILLGTIGITPDEINPETGAVNISGQSSNNPLGQNQVNGPGGQ